jgi:hypothetical protein
MRRRRSIGPYLLVVLAGLGLAPAARTQPSDDWGLRLSVPYINSFYLQPTGELDAKANTGFWGLGVGLLFRHASSQYLGLEASVATDLPVPMIGAVDFYGEHEFMTSYAVDLTNNHVWRRFSLGYGLSYGMNRWDVRYFYDPEVPAPPRAPIERRGHSLGPVFPAHYALNERFAVGLVYRPYLYRFGAESGFRYEHVISVDIAWRLGLH